MVYVSVSYEFRRDTTDDSIVRNITADHRPCSDDRSLANGHPGHNGHVVPAPDEVFELNRFRRNIAGVGDGITVVEIMILRDDGEVVSGMEVVPKLHLPFPQYSRSGVQVAVVAETHPFAQSGDFTVDSHPFPDLPALPVGVIGIDAPAVLVLNPPDHIEPAEVDQLLY